MPSSKNRYFRCSAIFVLIASILLCIACNASSSNRFYFATSNNGKSTLSSQYLSSSSAIHFDFAGEETLRSATSTYSNFNHSIMRNQRINYQIYLFFIAFLWADAYILFNILRSYGYQVLPKQNFSSIRIAKFIEYSDGKKQFKNF